MYICVCACYLRGLVGSPAVLMAVEAGQQHVLVRVHLAEAQRLVGVVADHVVTVEQLLGLWVPILTENSRVGGNTLEKKRQNTRWYVYSRSMTYSVCVVCI